MQLEFLAWLQTWRFSVLDYIFLVFTLLGVEYFYLLVVSIMYWCINRKASFRIGCIFILSMFINDTLKNLFHSPRPAGPGLQPLFGWTAGGYSFPSGHAQGAATFWGALARISGRKPLIWVAAVMIFLVSFSRLYLGVHYPVDVVVGIVIGLAAAWLLYHPSAWWEKFLQALNGIGVVLASCSPLLLLFINHEPIAMKTMGALCGFSLGHVLTEKRGGLSHTATFGKQVAKVLLGILCTAALYVAPKLLLPESQWSDVLRYWLITWAATFVVPEILVRTKLAHRES